MPQQFTIRIEETVLTDLHRRLAVTRWPDEIDNDKWAYGTNKSYLQDLCDYWQHQFDWNAQEAYLNSFQHYKTTVDDVGLHFIHQTGAGKRSIPLLLVHGWPDSFVRFLKIIPLLTAADTNGLSFDVVIPSIPGFGFSDIPQEPGMNPRKIAGLFNELMTKELGYKKYMAQGGDWGSSITEQLALCHDGSLWEIYPSRRKSSQNDSFMCSNGLKCPKEATLQPWKSRKLWLMRSEHLLKNCPIQ